MLNRKLLRVVFVSLVPVVAVTPPAFAASEAKDLRSGLAAVAQVIKQVLAQESEDAIAIGPFVGPTSAGPGIVQMLAEELKKVQVSVKDKTKYTIRGEFEFSKADQSLKIDAKIVENPGGSTVLDLNFPPVNEGTDVKSAGIQKGKIEIETKDERSMLALAGVNVAIPADARAEERKGMIFDGVKEPASQVVGGTKLVAVASSGARSPYGLEVVVGGQPRTIAQSKDDPEPSVKIDRGEVYEVRIVNDSENDAAVELRIDGVSSFAFSKFRATKGPTKGEPLYNHWIIPAKSTAVIKGWHVDNSKVSSFLVGEFGEGAALLNSLPKDTSKFGTISATFSAAWPANEQPPKDEPPRRRKGPNLPTLGPPKDQASKEVKRIVGVPRASVSVRYSKSTDGA
jgi:hypothetical protein